MGYVIEPQTQGLHTAWILTPAEIEKYKPIQPAHPAAARSAAESGPRRPLLIDELLALFPGKLFELFPYPNRVMASASRYHFVLLQTLQGPPDKSVP